MTKLKEFILSQLRELNIELYELIKLSSIGYKYDTVMDFSSQNPLCEILISDINLFKKAQNNQYHYVETLKPIVAMAKNIDPNYYGTRIDYSIDIVFKFDLQNWEDINISNINENLGSLESDKQKMIQRYNSQDHEGALSAAKSLLESAFKTYLDQNHLSYTRDDDFPKLQKKVFDKIEETTISKNYYQKIINGIKTICMGINETRNNEGDSHGNIPENRPPIDQDMVKIILETTISVTYFILNKCTN